jgi:lipopolysaccharide transport system ATP-binding protein
VSPVIQVDSLWKKYRLGVLGTGTLSHDLNRWWHRVRGKPDPYEKVGEGQGAEKLKTEKLESAENPDSRRLGISAPQPSASQNLGVSGFQRSGLSASQHFSISDLSSDEIWALRDISFEVKQGEILGVIGRNGAGKSTLLKIFSRVTAPTHGEVRVQGRIASLLEVGTGFHPELTGRENIFLNGAILGMKKVEIRNKLDEIVAFAEVEQFIDTPVKRYSSGMYVRLAFAVAAHLEPEILIVDEVLAVGDAQFQKKCLGKMGEVSRGGRTVLFVSHNMGAIMSLCSKALLLEAGGVGSLGAVDAVIARYCATGELSSEMCLNDVSARRGASQVLRFLRVAVDGQGGTYVLPPGKTVALEFDLHPTQRFARLQLSVAFNNQRGERIFSVASWLGPERLPVIEDRTVVCARFEMPPVFPGLYSLDIGCYDTTAGLCEEYFGAGRIEVPDTRYLEPAETLSPGIGSVLVKSSFWIRPNLGNRVTRLE